jgi:hypothetical protein
MPRKGGVLVALLFVAAGAVPASASAAWTIVPSPNPAGSSPTLLSVSADASSDAVTVGEVFNRSTGHYLTVAERWNGTGWSITPTQNPSSDEWLNGVAAISPTNAWAAGFQNNSAWAANRTLIEHWNGTSWSTVVSPNPSGGYDDLWGTFAASSTDVWAVGRASTTLGGQATLTEHWNGTSWSVVPSPNASSYDDLHRVFGSSSTDVWAVGTAYNTASNVAAPLIEHWNGSAWRIVPSPVLGSSYLRGAWATAPGDAWIVGEWDSPAPAYTPHVLIYHWDGTSWKSVTSPSAVGYALYGVTASSQSDAWISGVQTSASGTRTLIEHWNGSQWSVVASPNKTTAPNATNELNAITMLPSGLVWAVGDATGGGTLVERNLQG